MALADMPVAIDRIMAAIARRTDRDPRDYDVDGVTSTVILKRALELLAPRRDFIPSACATATVQRPASSGCMPRRPARDLGRLRIRGDDAAPRRELGVDLIITDITNQTPIARGAGRDQPEATMQPAKSCPGCCIGASG